MHKMKFWLILVVTIPAVYQAAGVERKLLYNPNFDKVFVNGIFLKNFTKYLSLGFNQTQICYTEIQDKYKELISTFKENTKEVPYSANFFFNDKGYYNVAKKALEKLHQIGQLMNGFEIRLRDNLKKGDKYGAYMEIKGSKEHAIELFKEYLKYKDEFLKKPSTVRGVFDEFYKGFKQIKLVMQFNTVYMKFKYCREKRYPNGYIVQSI